MIEGLSPAAGREVLEMVADKLVARIFAQCEPETLVVLPLDAVGAMTGLGPKQVARVMATVPLGARKRGVTLKALNDYKKGLNS